MADVIKRGKGSESFQDASIDLSAGFVPKNAPAAGEQSLDELTPDRFMAQQAKLAAAPAELTFDSFMAQRTPVTTDGGEAKPIDGKAGLTWRWATKGDMPAVELLHFKAEVSAGRGMFLPDLSFPGAIAVCERNGEIIGGVFAEESTTITLIGSDPIVLESAGDFVVPACTNLARELGTRLLHSSLPTPFAEKLDGALKKAGFKTAEPESVSYHMEVQPKDSSSTKRNRQ